ncbi:MAG: hypothetical protein JO197_09550 [Acidobacteria bacterium]|nr:hypothetical protein [Acidobacteriota bacterium]MBV9477341.1 hypothetical protein [Acidobacteriota bacterium]
MRTVLLSLLLVVAACKVDEKGNVKPSAETQTATAAAKENAKELGDDLQKSTKDAITSDAGQRVIAQTKDVARQAEHAAGVAAEETGEALAQKGRDAQNNAQQHAPATATSGTVVTTTTVTTTSH